MKSILTATLLSLIILSPLGLSGLFLAPALAETKSTSSTELEQSSNESTEKTVFVKGMVCAFCAQGIEKRFSGEPELENINVDLPNHKVILKFKPGQSMSDEKIASLLEAAGYSVDATRTN